MYQELSRKRIPSFLEGTVATIVIFAMLFGFNFILSMLLHAHAGYTDVVTIIFFVFIAYWVIYKYTITYKYMLISNEFIVQQIKKSKEKVMLNISVEQIKTIGLVSDPQYEEAKKRVKNRYKYYDDWRKSKRYFCIYEDNEEEILFEFHPSDKMIELITGKLNDITALQQTLVK